MSICTELADLSKKASIQMFPELVVTEDHLQSVYDSSKSWQRRSVANWQYTDLHEIRR
jgi:hypothetical protein